MAIPAIFLGAMLGMWMPLRQVLGLNFSSAPSNSFSFQLKAMTEALKAAQETN